MEANIKVEKKFELILDSFEAKWLMDIMQNELYKDESDEDLKMRYKFFWIFNVSINRRF